jgi:hypothetical protein
VEKWLVPVKEYAASRIRKLSDHRQRKLLGKLLTSERKEKAVNKASIKRLYSNENLIETDLPVNANGREAANMQEKVESKAASKQPDMAINKADSKDAEKVAINAAVKQKEKQVTLEQQDFTSALLEARKKNKIRK